MIALTINGLKFGDSSKNVAGWVVDLKNRLEPFGGGFAIPPDSGLKTALARLVSALFASLTEPVIYISEWGVWESSQNIDIFDSYRKAKGEAMSLSEKPVHCFISASEESFIGILCLVLYFVWDAEVFDREGKCIVSISHDEWFEIRTNNEAVRQICDQAAEEGRFRRLVNGPGLDSEARD